MNYKKLFLTVCFSVLYIGLARADYESTVKTPKGSTVPVIIKTWELSSSEIKSLDNKFKKSYPNAHFIRSSSRKYNCHSYAWYNSAATSKWMNSPARYMSDGSYYQISLSTPPSPYTKVYYPNGNHSARMGFEGGGYHWSKWGSGPVMQHKASYSPYNSRGLRYYLPR